MLETAIASGALSDAELRIGLEDAWMTCEWPGRAADYEGWGGLFEFAGTNEHRYLDETQLPVTGSTSRSSACMSCCAGGYESGLSRTTSFERARWFATRLGALGGDNHRIYEIDVPREATLASFHDTQGEQEIIVDLNRAPNTTRHDVEPTAWEHLLNAGVQEQQDDIH